MKSKYQECRLLKDIEFTNMFFFIKMIVNLVFEVINVFKL